MKRLGVGVLGAALCLAAAAASGSPGGGDQPPDKDKKGQSDLFKKSKQKEKAKPRDVLGTVELKDGSTVQCQFLKPKEMTLVIGDLGVVAVPLDQVRFVECEAPQNRVSTFNSDVFVGKIQTKEYQVKLLGSNKEVSIRQDRVKRMTFPDPPQPVKPLLPPEPEKDKDKSEKEEKEP